MGFLHLVKKASRRTMRILAFKKGVYCSLGKGNKICKGVFLHENTEIGNYNYIGHYTMTLNAKIGNYCSIASGVKIGQGNHDLECISTSTHIYKPINKINGIVETNDMTVIENDVWIAANACIMPGVKIGTGAVVGAGAVVTKDVPPYAIVVGVPAKVLRYRFDEETIKKNLESEWWTLPKEEAIKKCIALQEEKTEKVGAI